LPILDFGLEDKKDKNMNKTFGSRHRDSPSDNRKSKIKNPKFALVGAMLLALCSPAMAQQQSKIPKIGWLGARTPSGPGGGPGTGAESFRREFSKLGYVEGKNITIEYRYANDQLDRLPGLVDELVRLKIDLLIAPTTLEARAGKNATRTIPIVFFNVPDPVASGLVDSLSRPGGNITGFTTINAVLAGKRLELLKETIPNLSRIAVLWDPQNPAATQQWKESQQAARELGLQLHSMEVSSADKYEGAFKEAIKSHSAALVVSQGSLVASNQKQVVDLAAKNRLPAIYTQENYVASGGLMSYGPDRAEPFRRAAVMVDKILKGTKPADLPVEQPMKFEFVINLKAAKQIGLTIPPNVLVRADRVIK
jgi:putative tryptophan/tyrosine transport system substrate-binding protein